MAATNVLLNSGSSEVTLKGLLGCRPDPSWATAYKPDLFVSPKPGVRTRVQFTNPPYQWPSRISLSELFIWQ